MDRDFNLTKKPVTPLVGVDVFIPDSESRVLLIKRTDNGFWCTPGGSQDLGETPEECGVREVLEETGFEIKINRLLGVFSSLKYESVNYPWKGREYLHCFFMGEIIAKDLNGEFVSAPLGSRYQAEEIGWFSEINLIHIWSWRWQNEPSISIMLIFSKTLLTLLFE